MGLFHPGIYFPIRVAAIQVSLVQIVVLVVVRVIIIVVIRFDLPLAGVSTIAFVHIGATNGRLLIGRRFVQVKPVRRWIMIVIVQYEHLIGRCRIAERFNLIMDAHSGRCGGRRGRLVLAMVVSVSRYDIFPVRFDHNIRVVVEMMMKMMVRMVELMAAGIGPVQQIHARRDGHVRVVHGIKRIIIVHFFFLALVSLSLSSISTINKKHLLLLKKYRYIYLFFLFKTKKLKSNTNKYFMFFIYLTCFFC